MSFEDEQFVEFDYDNDEFFITNNSGEVRSYKISDEPDLVRNILNSNERGDINVFIFESEQREEFESWQEEIREEYREKYGEDFDDWRW